MVDRSRPSVLERNTTSTTAAVSTSILHRLVGGNSMEFEMDWNENRAHLLAKVGELQKLSPDTVKGYLTVSGAGRKTAHMDEKMRQLISLAVAVTTRCDGCISIHSAEALKAGATREELAEALSVAVAMNAGAALVYSTRALEAFDVATEA